MWGTCGLLKDKCNNGRPAPTQLDPVCEKNCEIIQLIGKVILKVQCIKRNSDHLADPFFAISTVVTLSLFTGKTKMAFS
jgi:hypothetical protein